MADVSRRTIVKGAAWSVPVVAMATAAPAFAASGGDLTITGAGCKFPGNSNNVYKGYAFKTSANNTTDSPITIDIQSMTLNGSDLGSVLIIDPAGCSLLGTDSFAIPAKTSYHNLALVTKNHTNSANGQLIVTYTTVPPSGTHVVYATSQASHPIQGSCRVFTSRQQRCINRIAANPTA